MVGDVPPIVETPIPLKKIVLVPALKDPLLVQLPVSENVGLGCVIVPLLLMKVCPETVRLRLRVNTDLTIPPTVSDLQEEVELTVGWLAPVKLASPMIASVDEVGTPAVQLVAVVQLVLVVPVQLV